MAVLNGRAYINRRLDGSNPAAMGVDAAYQQQLAAANQRAALAEQRAAEAEAKASPLVYSKGSAQPYMDAYNKSASMMKDAREEYRKSQSELRDAYRKQMETELNDNLTKSNQEYDASGRQNYINYMQAQKRLPDELNALGIRGGASESSLIRLGTNYGSNVASNESARQGALDAIRQAYAQQVADYNKDLNERLAQAQATAEQNQINWEREQLDKDLQRFSGVIEGLYNDRSSYEALIKQLQASNDPNKEYKIMLATRAMNMLSASSGGGGGGGGYSRGRSYGGGSYGSGGNSSGTSDIAKASVSKVANALTGAVAKSASRGTAKKTNIKGDFYKVNNRIKRYK